jgi:protein-disulfide isomerase
MSARRRQPKTQSRPAVKPSAELAPAVEAERAPTTSLRRYPLWAIALVAVVAWAAVVAVVLFASPGSSTGGNAFNSPSYADGMALGSKDAKVQIAVYSDFQCSYCSHFALDTLKQLEEAYVKSGKVRIEFRNYAWLGQESIWAAEAAEAANEQGAFWPYHDKLMSSQRGENQGAFTKENLERFAAELGLNQATFNAALDSNKYAQKVADDAAAAKAAGVKSTPYVLIDGVYVGGDEAYEVFQTAIEKELSK